MFLTSLLSSAVTWLQSLKKRQELLMSELTKATDRLEIAVAALESFTREGVAKIADLNTEIASLKSRNLVLLAENAQLQAAIDAGENPAVAARLNAMSESVESLLPEPETVPVPPVTTPES